MRNGRDGGQRWTIRSVVLRMSAEEKHRAHFANHPQDRHGFDNQSDYEDRERLFVAQFAFTEIHLTATAR
jgi:hypothetical protein